MKWKWKKTKNLKNLLYHSKKTPDEKPKEKKSSVSMKWRRKRTKILKLTASFWKWYDQVIWTVLKKPPKPTKEGKTNVSTKTFHLKNKTNSLPSKKSFIVHISMKCDQKKNFFFYLGWRTKEILRFLNETKK